MPVCPVILVLLATMSAADGAPPPSLAVTPPGAPAEGRAGAATPPASTAVAPAAAPITGSLTTLTTPAAPTPTPTTAAPAPPGKIAVPPQPRRRAVQVRDEDQEEEDVQGGLLTDTPSPWSRTRTAAWAGAGLTTLLLAVAAFYGASAASKAGDANRLLIFRDPDSGIPEEYALHAQSFDDTVSTGRRDDRLARSFVLAAGLTAVASAVLFIIDARRAPPGRESITRFGGQVPATARTSWAPLRRSRADTGWGLSWTF